MDDHLLLLCDGSAGTCQATAHTYCVGLQTVPKGDWYCGACAATAALAEAARERLARASAHAANDGGAAEGGASLAADPLAAMALCEAEFAALHAAGVIRGVSTWSEFCARVRALRTEAATATAASSAPSRHRHSL